MAKNSWDKHNIPALYTTRSKTDIHICTRKTTPRWDKQNSKIYSLANVRVFHQKACHFYLVNKSSGECATTVDRAPDILLLLTHFMCMRVSVHARMREYAFGCVAHCVRHNTRERLCAPHFFIASINSVFWARTIKVERTQNQIFKFELTGPSSILCRKTPSRFFSSSASLPFFLCRNASLHVCHVCLLPQTWHVDICHVSVKSGKANTTLVPESVCVCLCARREEFRSFKSEWFIDLCVCVERVWNTRYNQVLAFRDRSNDITAFFFFLFS